MKISGIVMSIINIAYVVSGFVLIYFDKHEFSFGKALTDQLTYLAVILGLVIYGIYEDNKIKKYWFLYGFSSFLLYIVSMNISDNNILLLIYLICFVISIYCLFGFYKYFKKNKKTNHPRIR